MDGEWIETRIQDLKDAGKRKSKSGLAAALGLSPARVTEMIRGGRRIQISEISAMSRYLELARAELIKKIENDDTPHIGSTPGLLDAPHDDHIAAAILPDSVFVPELDVQVAAGGGVVIDREYASAFWPMPQSYVRHFLGVGNPASLIMVEVQGDSMVPTLRPGDRVLVDTGRRIPSPPGVFVVWDGLGTVIKRLEHVHGSAPPTYRIISENPQHVAYERTAEESTVVGRVVWLARRL